ncbi:MAG: hypothetical protein COA99_14100 [Moraxellaceae bacterium]|nr:MAG: hypothetical protein COA99_14100 [Moraxellaceae bacterium]
MTHVIVSLQIHRDEYLAWYQGAAKMVSANTIDGKSIQFPANILRPFVTHDGVTGTFAIYFDEENKFNEIKRLK